MSGNGRKINGRAHPKYPGKPVSGGSSSGESSGCWRVIVTVPAIVAAWMLAAGGKGERVCPRCDGEGTVTKFHLIDRKTWTITCPDCNGTGRR